MRAITGEGGQGLESLRLEDWPVPEPAPGEARVRLKAATLNYRDYLLLTVGVGRAVKTPRYVPLSCGCGVVEAVGEGVSRVAVGDRVVGTFHQGWIGGAMGEGVTQLGGSVDGMAREYVCLSQEGLVRVPDELGDMEAATLPCAGLTSWNSLFGVRQTVPGDLVLLQGTGGVSIAALQLAKAAGAVVAITSSSDAKLARARAMGADHLINYRTRPDWHVAMREATGGRGADVLLDVAGGEDTRLGVQALAPGGIVASIGLLSGSFTRGQDVGAPLAVIRVGSRDQLEALMRGVAATGVRPVTDRVFPLERLGEALATLKRGEVFGKVGIDLTL